AGWYRYGGGIGPAYKSGGAAANSNDGRASLPEAAVNNAATSSSAAACAARCSYSGETPAASSAENRRSRSRIVSKLEVISVPEARRTVFSAPSTSSASSATPFHAFTTTDRQGSTVTAL